MESQPQIPEFRINPENFHPCIQQNQVSLREVQNDKDHTNGRF